MTYRKRLKIFSVTVAAFLFLIPYAKVVKASNIVFEDNFDNGNTDQWAFQGISGWNIVSGEYGIHIDPGTSNTFPKDDYWESTWKNIDYQVDLRGVSGTDKNILVKYIDQDKFVEIHHSGGYIHLAQYEKGLGSKDLDTPANYPLLNGQIYHFEILIYGNEIKVYINHSPQPILDGLDTINASTNWKIGLRAGTGAVHPTEVWFDNVKVTLLDPPEGPFELPFNYDGRGELDAENFNSTFNSRYTSLFDHNKKAGSVMNYEGQEFKPGDCSKNNAACYDSHNGIDFDDTPNDNLALSVASGSVVFDSNKDDKDKKKEDKDKCKNVNGFGCMVIVDYSTTDYENLYGLYGHLETIEATAGSTLTENSVIGEIGKTGDATGTHLHFSVMHQLPAIGINSFKKMTKSDWENLVDQITLEQSSFDVNSPHKSSCTYTAKNGLTYAMVDPNGWEAEGEDPYSLSKDQGGCDITSQNLWKYKITLE